MSTAISQKFLRLTWHCIWHSKPFDIKFHWHKWRFINFCNFRVRTFAMLFSELEKCIKIDHKILVHWHKLHSHNIFSSILWLILIYFPSLENNIANVLTRKLEKVMRHHLCQWNLMPRGLECNIQCHVSRRNFRCRTVDTLSDFFWFF